MKRLRDSLGKTPPVEGRLENSEDIISSGRDFDAGKVGLIETTIHEHLGQHLHDHSLFGGAQKPVRVFSLAQFRVELAYPVEMKAPGQERLHRITRMRPHESLIA